MSAISLKSITGITSITTPSGVDNQLTLHNNNTTEAVKLDTAGNLHFHNHLNITGISTAANFKTGTSNLHNTGLNVFDLDVDGHTNLDNVSVAGVTTFASGNVQLASDSQRLQLGSGQDLWMYHTGTSGGGHGLIQNDYGVMYMLSDSFTFRDRSTNHDVFKINENNAVSLYYQNNAKLSTTTTGVSLPQDLDVDGHTNLDNVSIAGVTTTGNLYADNLYANSSLTLNNNASVSVNLTSTSTTGSSRIFFGDPDSALVGRINYSHNDDDMQFYTAYGERLRITSDGRLLMGVTTSQQGDANLQVFRAATTSRITFGNENVSASGVAGIDFCPSNKVMGSRIECQASEDFSTSANRTADLVFFTRSNGTSSEKVRIKSDGKVGIGDDDPNYMLQLKGTIPAIAFEDTSGTHGFSVIEQNDDNLKIRCDAGNQSSGYNSNIRFEVDGTEKVRIDSSGRVLIGGGSSPSQVGDARLLVYSDSRLHPAIKADCIDGGVNRANGYTIISDNYAGDESQVNLGVSYSSSGLVLSRGVKVSNAADDTYLSSQDSYAMRPCAIKLDDVGAFNFLTTETNATTTTDSAVSLTEVFKIDRVGNIYQKISARYMYFGASNQLRIGVQGNGDSNIEAVTGDLKIMDAGSVITQVRSDGLENFQHVYPAADNSKDLGKSSRRWANIYTTDLHLSNEGKSNVVDGTWGDWTLQEGENKIYMINNRTGKKYSLKMEEE